MLRSKKKLLFKLTFTTPPAGALSFSGIVFGIAVPINTILDGSVTPVKLSTGGPTWNTSGDVNIAGIVTATSASIGYDNVGINSSGISVTGVITSTSFVPYFDLISTEQFPQTH